MATDLEAVATGHETLRDFYAEIGNAEGAKKHTEAAAAIRAAMGEIERLRAESERTAQQLVALEAQLSEGFGRIEGIITIAVENVQ
jgi:predicted  nucleic acid-binding Zn-ribbon protein